MAETAVAAIAIIGGGIVGSAAAVWLAAEGHRVTVFERAPDTLHASSGNAGLVALPDITPLARPGILYSAPGWLFDPLGPLAVRLGDLPRQAPWLVRFVSSARPDRVNHATIALATLMKTALVDHQELARRAGLSRHMRKTGALHVYETVSGFRAGEREWKHRQRHGVDYSVISAEEARRVVPALAGPMAHVVYAPDYWTVTSPKVILDTLRRRVADAASLVEKEVIDLRSEDRSVSVITAEGGDLAFDRVVVAGGVWSRDIVRRRGLSVLLEAERGYNTTFADPAIDLPLPVFFAEHGFVATPLADGLRVGGAVELASPEAAPNFERAGAMRKVMRRFVPDLPEIGGIEWMGSRPATPDSLPVIGPDPRDRRIVYAFGHGHLGLTLSAVTARRVAEIAAGAADPSMRPFGIERFQRKGQFTNVQPLDRRVR